MTLPLAIKTRSLLIVDDDPIELALAIAAVESSGFEILQAQSAVQALDALAGAHVDVLLSDFRIPEEESLWLLEQVTTKHLTVLRLLSSSNPPAILPRGSRLAWCRAI